MLNSKKIEDYSLSYMTYSEAGNMPYLPRKCFDNTFNVFINSVEAGKGISRVLSAVYGVVVSGIPFENGVAVYHGWNEFMGDIIDTTMIAEKKTIQDINAYAYIEWKRYSAEALVTALEENANDYPAEKMKRDKAFAKAVEDMGYKIIG